MILLTQFQKFTDIKGLVHPEITILSLLTIMLFQTSKTFINLQNSNLLVSCTTIHASKSS